MPKLSRGLDYFDLQTDLVNDKRIKLLKAEFGIKGFGIWIELLRQIYADEGYFLKWDNDTKLLFASDVGESGGLVDEVINGLVKRGLFEETVFNRFDVLTSKHIQEKYFNAIKRRSTETTVDARFLVIPREVDILAGNVNIKLLNVNIKEQRKEEKRKEEKRRENKRAPAKENYRESVRLKPDEYDKLCEEHDKSFVEQCLDKLNNYKISKGKKYKSDYRAILSWVVQAVQEDQLSKQRYEQSDKTKGDRRADLLRDTYEQWPE